MHRKGHVGMTLLAFAPVAYVLISEGKPLFAALCWLGIQTVEPWPDQDFHLPFFTHRGVSHSLLAILVVGGVLGAVGWFLGGNLFDLLLAALLAGGDLFGWILDMLPDATADMINLLLPNISLEAIVNHAREIAGTSVNQWTFAAYGLFVGSYGIFSHLLGDVITMSGIKPFLPLSRWRLSLSSLHADSPTANSSLFFIGILAVGVVLAMTVPATLGLAVPANLSPIGVASAQDASPSAHNGSVTINESATNRSRIILESVTLPQHGYIVARTGNLSANQSTTEVVGHTAYVQNGTFQGVVLQLNESVAKGTSVVVTLHNDTNGNETWDGIQTDAAYSVNGTPVHDSIQFTENQNGSNSTASVVFTNQTTNGTNVTISSVTLPDGGYVALHDSSYLNEMAPKNLSVIAVSRYLPPGHYENLTIPIRQSAPGGLLNKTRLDHTQRLVAVPYHETTGNHRYEFVLSFGENDTPYLNQTAPIADPARVAVRGTRGAPGYEPPTAAVTVSNQTVNGLLSVSRVRLPDGGFVVVRTASPENGSLKSVIGHSQYLTPGTHHNISVPLNGSIQQRRSLVVVPARDTNDNRRYDFVKTNGFQDTAYRDANETGAVATRVVVHSVGGPTTATATGTRTGTETSTSNTTTGTVESGDEAVIFGLSLPVAIVAGIFLVIVSLTVIGRLGRR